MLFKQNLHLECIQVYRQAWFVLHCDILNCIIRKLSWDKWIIIIAAALTTVSRSQARESKMSTNPDPKLCFWGLLNLVNLCIYTIGIGCIFQLSSFIFGTWVSYRCCSKRKVNISILKTATISFFISSSKLSCCDLFDLCAFDWHTTLSISEH